MFKKMFLIKPIFSLALMLPFCQHAKSSSIYEQYLDLIENEFDRTEGQQNKYLIVTRPINEDYLCELKDLKDLDMNQLLAGVSSDPLRVDNKFNTSKTTPLSLSISLGKALLVEKFLTVIKDVNDSVLTAWGYRQPYTLTHMALDPQFPLSSRSVPLKDRIAIIDALGRKGADFNKIIEHNFIGIYTNPPLAAGEPSGRELRKISTTLRALALLFGADPDLRGSSFSGVILKHEYSSYKNMEITQECLKQYLEKVSSGESISPLPKVLKHLKKAADELGLDLTPYSVKQKNDQDLAKYKSQTSKKAKRKVHHLQNVRQELEQDLKRSNQIVMKLLTGR